MVVFAKTSPSPFPDWPLNEAKLLHEFTRPIENDLDEEQTKSSKGWKTTTKATSQRRSGSNKSHLFHSPKLTFFDVFRLGRHPHPHPHTLDEHGSFIYLQTLFHDDNSQLYIYCWSCWRENTRSMCIYLFRLVGSVRVISILHEQKRGNNQTSGGDEARADAISMMKERNHRW